jgi:hypothetical protein
MLTHADVCYCFTTYTHTEICYCFTIHTHTLSFTTALLHTHTEQGSVSENKSKDQERDKAAPEKTEEKEEKNLSDIVVFRVLQSRRLVLILFFALLNYFFCSIRVCRVVDWC